MLSKQVFFIIKTVVLIEVIQRKGDVRHTCIVNILGWTFTAPEISTYNYQWFKISVYNEKFIKYPKLVFFFFLKKQGILIKKTK